MHHAVVFQTWANSKPSRVISSGTTITSHTGEMLGSKQVAGAGLEARLHLCLTDEVF